MSLDLIDVSQASKEVTSNELDVAEAPAALFAYRASTTTGLIFGYYGGAFNVSGTPSILSNGTIAMSAASTNYIEADPTTGVVSKNTTGWTGDIPLYTVVTNATNITAITDYRSASQLGGSLPPPIVPIGYAQSTETYASSLTIDCSAASTFDVTLTGNITIGFDNPAYDGQKITLRIRQDGGGSNTVAFDSTVRFGTDITGFTATVTGDATDIVGLIYNAQDDVFDFVAAVKGF